MTSWITPTVLSLAMSVASVAAAAPGDPATPAADDARAREAIAMAPRFLADHAALREMADRFEHASWYAVGAYHFELGPRHEENAVMPVWGQGWAATQADFARLRAIYAPLVDGPPLRGRGAARQRTMAEVVDRGAVAKFEAFRAAVAGFVQAAPDAVDADARELAGLVATAAAALDLRAVLAPQGRIQLLRNRLANLSAVYAPLVGAAERERVVHAAREAEARAAAAIAALTVAAIDARRAPADLYTGDERAALTAFVTQAWAKEFPGDTIVQLRFRAAAFVRRTSRVQHPSGEVEIKRDISRLPVVVIVAGAAGEAYLYGGTVRRDHLAGQRLTLDWIDDHPANGPAPTQRMRLANLDGGAR